MALQFQWCQNSLKNHIIKIYIFLLICSGNMFVCQFAFANFKPTLQVIVGHNILSDKLILQFEQENQVNVRIEFANSREEVLAHVKAGLRIYDVVIGNERVLEKLSLARYLKTLPSSYFNEVKTYENIEKPTKLNQESHFNLPLFVDPMGITYISEQTKKGQQISWDSLLDTTANPLWRQRVVIPISSKGQMLIALMATHQDLNLQNWSFPAETALWFRRLRLQNTQSNTPLALAFLGKKIAASVIFYSDYLRLKKIVPNLEFSLPKEGTYFDRIGIAWTSNSMQEALSKKFIEFIYKNRKNLAENNLWIDLGTKKFQDSDTSRWYLFDDEAPWSKKLENILKELSNSEKVLF